MRLRFRLRQLVLALVLLSGLGVVAAAAGGSATVADKTEPSILAGGRGGQPFRLADGSSAVSPSLHGEEGVPVSPSPLAHAGTSVGRPTASSATGGQTAHVVRFDPANGSAPVRSTVREGSLASPPANPRRDGYRFDGWMQKGRPFDFRIPVLQDMVLTAQWVRSGNWALSPDRGPAAGGIHLTISPPSGQEPALTCIQASGGRLTALSGDGSLYTWTGTSSPTRMPAPAQAGNGFRYLQAVSAGDWQMILGSDQQIYAWTASHPTPVPLGAGRDTRYTHISGNGERLLAVDRQGRVHVFQAGRQDPGPQPASQAETVLPQGKRAVVAVASAGRFLAVDEDGQAWSWSPGQADPHITRISQDPSRRIIQAEPLSQGILLLDADGQAHWLADEADDADPVNLTGGRPASRINTNEGQAVITDADGHLWAWKPGDPAARVHDDGRVWTQATSADGRITALDGQGGLASWGPSQASKPVVITIVSPPLLEAASLDGQPLRLTRISNAWQATTPAHKPGPASIAISGRQAGQPFAKNLEYTFEQDAGQTPGFARTTQPDVAFTVTFDTAGGSPQPTSQQIASPYQRVRRPTPDPERDGFLFDGWFNGKAAYDFSRPVTQNLALTARWTPDSWSINPKQGSQLGGQATTITPPATRGIQFNQISSGPDTNHSLAIGSDGNAYAWGSNSNGQLGDDTTTNRSAPITVRKPTGASKDFTYTQVSAAGPHSLAIGSDGYAYAWGRNQYGELGNNSTRDSHVPVRVRDPAHPNDPNAGLKATQVSGGGDDSLAVGRDGYAYAWGWNQYGELGNNSTSDSHVPVRVRDPAHPNDPNAGLKATQVSGGGDDSLAVGRDGYAYAWGWNQYGELGNNSTSDSHVPVRVRDPAHPNDPNAGLKATQVSGGGDDSLAVGRDGYAYAWGWNQYGELGNNSTSDSHVPVRVRDPAHPNDPNAGLKATQVSGGGDDSLAVGRDGYAYAWGWNQYGELGNNSTSDSHVPVRVRDPAHPNDPNAGLKATQAIGAGFYHSLAFDDQEGSIWAWGYNGDGELGNNSTVSSHVPVQVKFSLAPIITAARFDASPAAISRSRTASNSVTAVTPPHQPGPVTVSIDYTIGGTGPTLTNTSLTYTYQPLALPKAGGAGILLTLAAGATGTGAILASRRSRHEQARTGHLIR